MKKIRISIITDNPDTVGEFCRDRFFNQSDGKLGCYSTFDLRSSVYSLPKVKDVDGLVWHRAALKDLCNEQHGELTIMEYMWDGDGCLRFIFSNGAILENTDCKHTNGWEWVDI